MSTPGTQARPLIVIAGIGNGSGTGGATARAFAKEGYRVALIARGADKLKQVADDIAATGAEIEVAAFPIDAYSYQALTDVFPAIRAHPELRVAVYNAGAAIRKPFLAVTERNIQSVVDANVHGAFAFARGAIEAFRANALDARGKRGTLIFTGATGSLRGNVVTSAFSAGKFALRALSQSLNKEFGKENIHSSEAQALMVRDALREQSVIDGPVLTDWSATRGFGLGASMPEGWKENPDVRVDPASIAAGYLYLVGQDRSAWTWELDFRPAHERW
ncbi:NAD(P)-binding protein [Daedaleopsis nitida]|nr:NAD(P)-binding protein [Daedaleopsis nitida]